MWLENIFTQALFPQLLFAVVECFALCMNNVVGFMFTCINATVTIKCHTRRYKNDHLLLSATAWTTSWTVCIQMDTFVLEKKGVITLCNSVINKKTLVSVSSSLELTGVHMFYKRKQFIFVLHTLGRFLDFKLWITPLD